MASTGFDETLTRFLRAACGSAEPDGTATAKRLADAAPELPERSILTAARFP